MFFSVIPISFGTGLPCMSNSFLWMDLILAGDFSLLYSYPIKNVCEIQQVLPNIVHSIKCFIAETHVFKLHIKLKFIVTIYFGKLKQCLL